MTTRLMKCCIIVFVLTALLSVQAKKLYFSASESGHSYWDDVSGWQVYSADGGGAYEQLPTTNDSANVNAATLAAENGNALCVTNGVFAECDTFATGDYSESSDTAWFRLDGGSLTCRTHFVTGRSYPGLATLESGNLYGGGNFFIGSLANGYGTVSNNGATVNFNSFVLANYSADSPSTLVQTKGSLYSRGTIQIGYRGDAVMEINGGSVYSESGFSAGHESGSSGTLVLNEGSVYSKGFFVAGHESGSSGTLVLNEGSVYSKGSFVAGYNSGSSGTFVLNGGSITGNTWSSIGRYGQGLAILNTGTLHSAGNLYIGFYSGSSGVVTNNGAVLSSGADIRLGYNTGTFGKLVQNGGTLNTGGDLQIGNSGDAVVELNTGTIYCAKTLYIGKGSGGNGDLYMRGGQIHLQGLTSTNLYVRTGADRTAKIQGWGAFTNVNAGITLIMVNDGQIIADGEGMERDLNLNQFAVVDNWIPNGASGTNGWYAINKGRVLFPRTWTSFPAGSAKCWGDHYGKTMPEMVNSVALTFSSSVYCAVRGGFCTSDRSDIPCGLPEGNLRPIGIWCIGAYTDKLLLTQASFGSVSLDFRYDHTQVLPNDSSLRLYRYNGISWDKVGRCVPNDTSLISTDTSLTPVSSGDYNIGWFAVMAVEMSGTVIMVQ